MRRRALSWTAGICLAGALAGAARAADPAPDVHEHDLPNGMKVLVLEDHSIPNAALYVMWRVGSRNERPGITGIAHFFEHMMFLGGHRFGRTFDNVMEAAGGSNNAYTTRDVTCYQDWFPASELPLILDMEADRMSGMDFVPATVQSEREVVYSERRLDMEEPEVVLDEQLWAAAYTAHPYQWDVLGWPSDIEAWRQEDLEAFFTANYAPQNAVLVLVGAVDADAAFAQIEKRMAGIPRGPERRPVVTREPEQLGERRVVVEDTSGGVPIVMCAWHVPASAHADTPPLMVLEHMLLGGESSRLHTELVEGEQLCVDVSGGLQGLQFDPSLFVVTCTLRDGGDPAAAEARVRAAVARVAREGPTERELRAAQNTLRASILRRMKTIDGKAEVLAETEVFFGGWRRLAARLDALRSVTADDVKRVAAAYLTERGITVGTLLPRAAEPGDDEDAAEDGR